MKTLTLGAIALVGPGAPLRSGAAFILSEQARRSETVEVDGWEVEVQDELSVVVARGGGDLKHLDAFRNGLAIAQKGLDLMSASGQGDLQIRSFDDDHLTWWNDGGCTSLRITSIARAGFAFTATAEVRDKDGNVVPQNRPILLWHESFRYFRLSQTSDDLFDAFRNAYLALESILSVIAPQRMKSGKPAEGEGAWFERALKEAGNLIDLKPFAPPTSTDVVAHLIGELYRDTRGAMSHAKSGRAVLLPQSEWERSAVLAALRKAVDVYLKLAEVQLGLRRPRGGMFAITANKVLAAGLDGVAAFVTDDPAPEDELDTAPNPHGGFVVECSDATPTNTDAAFLATKTWTVSASDLTAIQRIRRFGATRDGELAILGRLEADLHFGEIDRLELTLGFRGINTQNPRERYSF